MSRAAKRVVNRIDAFGAAALKQLAALLAPAVVNIDARVIAPTLDRFHKVSADGKVLPFSAKEWEGVYDAITGLIWGRKLLPGEHTYADAIKTAAAATLCGAPARAPTVHERFAIVDVTRESPALDTNYFDASETSAWEWTSTKAPAPSGYAWLVYLGDGYSYRYDQGCRAHVRAVRAGQLSDIGK